MGRGMMRHGGLALLFVSLTLGSGRTAAQETSGSALQSRVSLDLNQAPLKDALETMLGILDAELDMEPGIDGRVEVRFRGLTVKTALAAICESAGCRCELIEGPPRVLRVTRDDTTAPEGSMEGLVPFRKGPPDAGTAEQAGAGASRVGLRADEAGDKAEADLTTGVVLEVTDADIVKLFRVFAELLDAGVLLDTALDGRTVSLSREGRISELMDEVCRQADCRWNFLESPRRLIEVSPDS